MSILRWSFGIRGGVEWSLSLNGNPTIIRRGHRITVFPGDGGWKYCIAKLEKDDDPFYSEAYETEPAAKYEALADIEGRESRYKPMYEGTWERRH